MQKGISKGLRSLILKAIAVTLAFVTIAGSLPSSAASSKEVEVKTKKQLLAQIAGTAASTIVFSTQKTLKFTIPASESSSNKKLIVNAPNVTLTNKATFKGVTLNETLAFTEKGKGNSLTVKAENAQITVAKGSEVKKMTIEGTGAKITVAKGSEVEKMNVAADKIDIDVLGKAKVGDLVCKLKGAEGSVVDSKSEDVNVKVSGKAADEVTEKVAGETVKEPEKKEEKAEEKKEEAKKEEEKKEDTTQTSSSSDQTPSGGGGTTDYSQTPNDKDLCTLAIDTSEGITTELYAGESKIVNESPLKKGTNLTLYFYVNDRTKNVVLYVNGQKKDYISFSWEPNHPRGYYSFSLLSDMTIRLICEDATWAFNTGTNGNTWLVLEETSEIINATGSSVTFNKNHFIKAKPDEGFVPRVKLGGGFVSLSLDTNTGEYSHWFTAYDTYVSEGKILIETEFVPKNTEYEVAFELATGGAFNIINVDENNKIIQNGEKVKAGSLIKVVAIPEGTNQLADVTLNWSEFANGPKAAWPVYVGDDGVIVNGDSRISVSFSRCKVTSRIIGDWSGGRTFLSGGKYSAGGGGVIDYGILVGKNSFAVTTELMPGYEVISFVINGEDHTEEMARNLSYDYVFKGDETEIYTETALGKIGNTYAKVVIEGNNELSRATLYYYDGREYRSVDMGKKDYIPIGTEVNLTASAKNGYKVDSIKAGETILEAGEFGDWKYIVNADVTFSAVTSVVP